MFKTIFKLIIFLINVLLISYSLKKGHFVLSIFSNVELFFKELASMGHEGVTTYPLFIFVAPLLVYLVITLKPLKPLTYMLPGITITGLYIYALYTHTFTRSTDTQLFFLFLPVYQFISLPFAFLIGYSAHRIIQEQKKFQEDSKGFNSDEDSPSE